MANKRSLKKEINSITDELLAECLFRTYLKETDSEKIDMLLSKIDDTRDNLIRRISHTDGKCNSKLVKKYYQKLNSDFDESLDDILEAMDQLSKEDEKEAE